MFPVIKTIDDIYPHIKGKDEFAVKERDKYICIDYVYQLPTTFENEYHLECRGVKFNKDGTILARPFHKFFNIGERENFTDINWQESHIVMDKLDGSMIHAAIVDGTVRFMTRAGITDVSEQAEKEVGSQYIYWSCHKLIKDGFTPIFEYTSPNNRIVIKYDKPQLRLLALRNMVDGQYVPYDHLKHTDFDIVANHERVDNDFMLKTKYLMGKEGYVIRFHTGHTLKVKADDYVLKHRVKSYFDHEKNVLELVLKNETDDLYGLLDVNQSERLRKYENSVSDSIQNYVALAENIVNTYKDEDQKSFAMMVSKENNILKSLCFAVRNGGDAREVLINNLLKKCKSQSSVDSIRDFIGVDWN